MGNGWFILLYLVFAGGVLYFSVSAIALRIFSRVRLQEAFGSADKEREVEKIYTRSEELVLTCSLFRHIFYILTVILVAAFFIRVKNGVLLFTDYVLIFLICLLTFIIFAVAIPHSWAKYSSETVIRHTYRLLLVLLFLSRPMLFGQGFTDTFVRRLVGVTDTTPQEDMEEKQEEFLDDLEEQRMQGVVDAEQQLMIEKVLELNETTAGEIMTPRTDIMAIEVNSDWKTVLEKITEVGHSRVPVYEGNIDNIVGLVYAKDILRDFDRPTEQFRLRDKIRNAYFVPDTKSIRQLLHEFQNQKLHISIVLDEYGGTAGLVTLEDIIEELVGEIVDEYDKKPPEPAKIIDENTIEVDARSYVDDLNDKFELKLPEEEDYDTIGGFVLSYLGHIPKTGVSFDYKNIRFMISSAEARRIKRIRIIKTSREKDAQ